MTWFLYTAFLVCLGLSAASAADTMTTVNSSGTATAPRNPGDYPLGPDSLPQEGVPPGRLEGPFLFRSRIFTNTVRKYWLFVPAQYTPAKPACVLVFQDGQRAT